MIDRGENQRAAFTNRQRSGCAFPAAVTAVTAGHGWAICCTLLTTAPFSQIIKSEIAIVLSREGVLQFQRTTVCFYLYSFTLSFAFLRFTREWNTVHGYIKNNFLLNLEWKHLEDKTIKMYSILKLILRIWGTYLSLWIQSMAKSFLVKKKPD